MRADMPHLLVERGHAGRLWSLGSKGWEKRCRFRYRDDHDADGDGWLPPRHRPQFSENLAPLYRYLAAQVGRPWDRVYSEIRQRIDTGNAVQYHILQHLYDRLAVAVEQAEDGSLWHHWHGKRRPLEEWGGLVLYVCPTSGLLRRVRHRRRPTPRPDPHPDRRPGPDPDSDYRRLQGQWYAVTWASDPSTGARIMTSKRQLNRRMLRTLGLRS